MVSEDEFLDCSDENALKKQSTGCSNGNVKRNGNEAITTKNIRFMLIEKYLTTVKWE